MNIFIEKHLDELRKTTAEIAVAMRNLNAEVERGREREREFAQQYWSSETQLAAAKDAADGYDALVEENAKLRSRETEARKHLEKVLQLADRLIGEFRP